MSSTTAPETLSDLQTDLIDRVRQATGVTATNTLATRYLNVALLDMHIGWGEKFPWAERNTVLRTHAAYTTGTVSISQGSTTLTGSGTLWDTQNSFGEFNARRATGKFVINGTDEIYSISTVGGDTSVTLATRYVGSTVSAGSYVYFEDEYDLASDFLRPLDLQFFDTRQDIELIGRREFRARYPRNGTTGKIQIATIVDRPPSGNTTPIRRICFWRPPTDAELIPYAYVTSNLVVSSAGAAQAALSASTDEPIVPKQYRHAITFHALYHWYRDRKDDARSQEARQEFTDLMLRIAGDQEIGRNVPMMRPRVSPYARSARQPWSGSRSTRYSVGGRFDRME